MIWFLHGIGFDLLCSITLTPPHPCKRKVSAKANTRKFRVKLFPRHNGGDNFILAHPAFRRSLACVGMDFDPERHA